MNDGERKLGLGNKQSAAEAKEVMGNYMIRDL